MPDRIKIVIDSAIPFIRGVFEPYARVAYVPGAAISHADIRDADALIIRTRTRCDRRLLEGSAVRFIATATIGEDHIDAEYCAAHGIVTASAPGSNARAVLQWEAAALAALAHSDGLVPQKTVLGVVGVGNTGSLTAEYARQWGFGVLECDPPRMESEGGGFVSFDRAAAQSDIITFHVPLATAGAHATHHMASQRFFDMLKPGAVVINSSRGEVADSRALGVALMKGRCRYIADTWEHEPDIDRRLLRETMIATPHIAGYSEQGKAAACAMAVGAAASFFGMPVHDWYPPEASARPTPRPISWQEMTGTIKAHYDISEDSTRLKTNPELFETLRNEYRYRKEYF